MVSIQFSGKYIVALLSYFSEQGSILDSINAKGMTPLHEGLHEEIEILKFYP